MKPRKRRKLLADQRDIVSRLGLGVLLGRREIEDQVSDDEGS
jgi:hypothetical protein